MIDAPRQVEWIAGRVDGRPGHRLMVVLAAPGCSFARLPAGGCTNCSFPGFFGVGRPVSCGEYLAQLEAAAGRIPVDPAGPVQVDLFVSGSFLNPEEVPEDAQVRLIERARALPGVRRILIETRPEYVAGARLARAREAAGPARLEVAIGLESADREIRERRIRKGFGWGDFERAARTILRHDADLMVHLLLKPIATGEREAVTDLIRSARRVLGLGPRVRIGLQPCFVAPGTPLERAFEAGSYRPPWLWSVVEVLRALAGAGEIGVGLSDEGMGPKRAARNCGACDARVRAAIAAFNLTQDAAELAGLDCGCRAAWEREVSARD